MNDEELVEVIAGALVLSSPGVDPADMMPLSAYHPAEQAEWIDKARDALAALRSAGFQVLPRLTALEEGQEELADWYAGGSG